MNSGGGGRGAGVADMLGQSLCGKKGERRAPRRAAVLGPSPADTCAKLALGPRGAMDLHVRGVADTAGRSLGFQHSLGGSRCVDPDIRISRVPSATRSHRYSCTTKHIHTSSWSGACRPRLLSPSWGSLCKILSRNRPRLCGCGTRILRWKRRC